MMIDMSLHYRKYKDYDGYLRHQPVNLRRRYAYFQKQFDARCRRIGSRIEAGFVKMTLPKGPILCLGARLGEEVKAFRDLGFSALGIDLYPGENNPYVVKGDFHNLQFDNQEFGGIYTNAIDHAFDLPKIASECFRVLRDDGFMFLDISTNQRLTDRRHVARPQGMSWEAMVRDKIDDVVVVFKHQGFTEVGRSMEPSSCKGKPFLGITLSKERSD